MKTKVFILIFSISAVFMSAKSAEAALIVKAPASIGLINGLVGHWTFDGNQIFGTKAADTSANRNHGTLTNNPKIAPGKLGQALEFSSSLTDNEYVLANTPLTAFPASICAWFKSGNDALAQRILTINDTSGESEMHIFLDGTSVGDPIGMGTVDTNGNGSSVTGGTYKANQWHHMCGAADTFNSGSKTKLYLDGVEVASGSIGQNPTSLDTVDIAVRDANLLVNDFIGSLDDLRIYNRVISAEEVKRLYRAGSTLKLGAPNNTESLKSGLTAHWTFDGADLTSTTAADKSGQGNHGGLNAGPREAPGKIGQALEFDGADDSVTPGKAITTYFSASVGTMAAWIKPSASQTAKTSVWEDPAIINDSGGILGIHLDSGGTLQFYNWDGSEETISTTWEADVWTHVAWVHSGGRLYGYKNGELIGSIFSGNSTPVTGNIRMGLGYQSVSVYRGLMDDVRTYNRALSNEDIKRLYKIGSTLKLGAPTTSGSLTSGLVGHWTFDGGSPGLDYSGNKNHGTLTNGPKEAPGKIGQALDFDGSDDYVSIGALSSVITGAPLSVSFWTKNSVAPAQFDGILGAASASTWNDGLGFYWETGSALRFWIEDEASNFVQSVVTPTEWNHIVGTWNGTTIRLYINGVEAGTPDTYSGSITTTATFALGRIFQDNENINGKIDDVRMYNRALSNEEVKRLYNLGR